MTFVADLIPIVQAETWYHEDIRLEYLKLLDILAWAEHCFFAGESGSSRHQAVEELQDFLGV